MTSLIQLVSPNTAILDELLGTLCQVRVGDSLSKLGKILPF